MDAHGIDVQVLSLTAPGIQAERDTAVAIANARAAYDFLAGAIAAHPTRFFDRLGVDAVMCEVDHPHGDSIWPDVRKDIDAQLTGLPEEGQYKIRVANAERVYGFEPSGLGRR